MISGETTIRVNRISASSRRALMLVVVLIMVVLLSLLAAGFTFMVRAHLNTVVADTQRYQARMAAEAGLQMAVATLREGSNDIDFWYNNPDRFHAFPVLGEVGQDLSTKIQKEQVKADVRTYDPNARIAWRCSLYAPNPDEAGAVRYGFTDESARIDLNSATEDQLRKLFESVIPQTTDFPVDIDVLVDSVLDWREQGTTARTNGAKDAYYQKLFPPYRCKSQPFSTVEELLLVRGFTAWVVFGEDYNQNGLLDPSENDGDASFPPDDEDGALFTGVSRYLTVWSQEMNIASDNQPRIQLNMKDTEKLQKKLEEAGIDNDIISYIMQIRSGGISFNSVMNLVPAPPPPEDEEGEEESTTQPDPSNPTTQGSGDGATSQPGEENPAGDGAKITDQHGTKDGSEKKGDTKPVTYKNLTDAAPPGTYEDLPLLLDRLSASPSPMYSGRINISTAPREVLGILDGVTPAEVDNIVATRAKLSGVERASPAWLLTQGVLEENKFRRILDKITTKSSSYRVESVGYADQVGVVQRLMMVFQMRGPVPQVIYYRNLDNLGVAYTPHGEELRALSKMSK